jgi:hypothetical protein
MANGFAASLANVRQESRANGCDRSVNVTFNCREKFLYVGITPFFGAPNGAAACLPLAIRGERRRYWEFALN